MTIMLIDSFFNFCKISLQKHSVRQRQGVTSVRVTSFKFLEAEPLVGEAGRGVELSRIVDRLPHLHGFVPSRLHHLPPPSFLVLFFSLKLRLLFLGTTLVEMVFFSSSKIDNILLHKLNNFFSLF